ncbi:MAG: class I SAM-dependent methyltransferase [Snowella sp.]|nr:class I SAM-dependent methyltransferase [Snowella sp.]
MWDERFNTPEYIYGTEPNDFLVSVASLIPSGKVLCLADGEGRNGTYLASLGYEVTAVDQSAVGLAKAEKLAQEKQVEIATIRADLADYVIETQFWDGIVSIYCHLPSNLRDQVYPQVVNGLKSNGVLILEGFAPEQLQYNTGGPKNLDMLPSLNTLKQELSGLNWEVSRNLERELFEGRYHDGKAAVIQLLGRKPF